MNRLVIIGNGFDLAHGLKTSYADFLEWYKKDYIDNIKCKWIRLCDDGLCKIDFTGSKSNEVKFDDIPTFDAFCKDYFETNTYKIYSLEKSILLSRIEQEYKNKGWVDIENDYYQLLKEIILGESYNKKEQVQQLNYQLKCLRDKLIEYLSIEGENSKVSKNLDLDSIFFSRIYFDKDVDNVYKDSLKEKNITFLDLPRENTLVLNFNYTKIADYYCNSRDFKCVHIHGILEEPRSIVFGYGDELDDEYKTIVKYNENEFLKNIKSFRYLEDSIYKQLNNFIESEKFQILILGHSCGNSDRVLLNTLFNHKNCVSIKPYYYINERGEDNYSELTMNISRNFNSPVELRSKVVIKKYCQPLQ